MVKFREPNNSLAFESLSGSIIANLWCIKLLSFIEVFTCTPEKYKYIMHASHIYTCSSIEVYSVNARLDPPGYKVKICSCH